MSIACPFCHTDNRDKARFCRGCARPLGSGLRSQVSAAGIAAGAPRHRRRRAAATDSSTSSARSVSLRWVLGLAVLFMVLSLGGWWGWWQPMLGPSRARAAPSPVRMLVPEPQAAEPDPVDRLRQSVAALAQQDRDRARALEQLQRSRPVDHPRAKDEASRRTATAPLSADAPVVSEATPASAPLPAEVRAPPPAPAPPSSVDQLCAGAGNLFSRDFCRMRHCADAVYARDPVCVRFRQMDEARRQRSDGTGL